MNHGGTRRPESRKPHPSQNREGWGARYIFLFKFLF
jgi:hypothetical protein